MQSKRSLLVALACTLLGSSFSVAAEIADLLPERLKSVVAVEFTIQAETERRQVVALGSVVNADGVIVLPGTAIHAGQGLDQLKDFKVYRANSDDSTPATYLGQDSLTGFHFVRVDESGREALKPLTEYEPAPTPRLAEELWGIGLRGKDEDFMPYVLNTRVALITRLPNKTALLAQDVASPGLPVFDREGRLAGLALNSFGQNFLLFSQRQSGAPVMLVNVEESSVVLLAEELLPKLDRVPQEVSGRPIPWIGIYGMQPVDPDVAKLLNLERKSGVVISDILEGSPADLAGLQDRDIVLAIDGEPLPRLKPDRVVLGFFGQEILRRSPGDTMKLTVLRGSERQELEVTLADEPKMVREADRRYFERLGFTVREFLSLDGIMHRARKSEHGGAVVHFLKPNSPAASGGLRPDDWIRQIDGVDVKTYGEAVEKLAAIEADEKRNEFVLLTSRGGETQVLRVKLR